MTARGRGLLPDRAIRELVRTGAITGGVEDDQVQPASLDLRLGRRAIRVRASFLAGEGRRVTDRLADFAMHEIDLTGGAVLEKGCVYLVEMTERLTLPEGVSAIANAKSSTGRLDLLTRIIIDGGTEFDRIPSGYDGPVYAEICPRSFSVLARTGQRLNQMRFRSGHAALSDDELAALHERVALVDRTPVIAGGLGFSVDLRPGGDVAGWRAKPHTGLIDLSQIAH